jgi:hypothetical protein
VGRLKAPVGCLKRGTVDPSLGAEAIESWDGEGGDEEVPCEAREGRVHQ